MKTVFLTAALGVVCVSASGQGTVNFANAGSGYIARVYDTDGVTGLAGAAWSADLYWAPGVVTDSNLLVPLNQPAFFSTIGLQAGMFFGGVRTISGTPGFETITAQVRVWDTASGSSWAAASTVNGARVGESILFQVIPMGYLLNPGIPTSLTALSGHPWSVSIVGVPEPSTLGLAGLGLAGMFILRRRTYVIA